MEHTFGQYRKMSFHLFNGQCKSVSHQVTNGSLAFVSVLRVFSQLEWNGCNFWLCFFVVFGYLNVKLWCIEGEFDREKIYQVGWTVVIYEWLRYSR